jgi:RNA polymerase sigma factor for flagellar operon FliA
LHRKPDQESGEDELIYVPTPPGEDPLSRCLRGELVQRLADAIEGLPERERVVMTLYYYEELTRSEIALALDVSDGRVQQIRTSAVLHLRSALSDLTPASRKPLTVIHGRGARPVDRELALGPAA